MRRYTWRENLVSALIGILIGLLAGLGHIHSVTHRTPAMRLPAPLSAEVYSEPAVSEAATQTTASEPADSTRATETTTAPAEDGPEISEEDLALMACLVYAEAGNQDQIGQRLVADVVLNRVASPDYPDTISGVIYERHGNVWQFTTAGNGALKAAETEVTESCIEAVQMELEERLDTKILFFTAGGFGDYGTPGYQHGDHYFSR